MSADAHIPTIDFDLSLGITMKTMRNRIGMFLMLQLAVVLCEAQTISKYIVVDQFGYLPSSKKIAVIRDPQAGFDAAESFTPGALYAVVEAGTNTQVFSAPPVVWNAGATDNSSGDKAWWFDFSSVNTPGSYYILDVDKNVKSYEFDISNGVYLGVLRHAVRAFFYQRVGFAKEAQHAGTGWADGASHMGVLQDTHARPYNDKNNAAKEVDVSGGWYDAGDFNKYTNWTANYVVDFMYAYLENPDVWTDDFNVPESGNGTPDLLDEAMWGIDHLLRMQQPDGSVLSIVGESHASPPSSATGQSLYGPANTSGTLNTAAALAIASKVYGMIGMADYATTLEERAVMAWNWADANPNVIFRNNEGASAGLGAGQQETDDYGRLTAKIEAAVFLFEITGDATYQLFVDEHYDDVNLIQWNFAFPFQNTNQEMLLYYASLPGATPAVASDIKAVYKNAMLTGSENFPAYASKKDPYLAHLKDYVWGSNQTKSSQGLMFVDMITYGVDGTQDEAAYDAAEQYIHYIHGVNPLRMVYLSNMYAYGAENGVNEFYHTWFSNGSAKWDRVGVSTYGPAPGFLVGGPNPSYDWDGCCPSGCGSNNAVCSSESLTPPKGQPSQKSYKDFNTSWPLNSWSVTENSNGYQIAYIRLLANFIQTGYDCNGTLDGTAEFDACNKCAGGDTGIVPVTDFEDCDNIVTSVDAAESFKFQLYPNPSNGTLYIESNAPGTYEVHIRDMAGKSLLNTSFQGSSTINVKDMQGSLLVVTIKGEGKPDVRRVIHIE